MITEEKLAELYSEMPNWEMWEEALDTLSALWRVAKESQEMIDDGMIVTNQLKESLAALRSEEKQ